MSSAEMSAVVPNHRRTKPGGIKPGAAANSGVTGPTSQIPGLCQTADTAVGPVERISGRRVGIFESDSDYTKLAKGGGHKGLLSHDLDAEEKPMSPDGVACDMEVLSMTNKFKRTCLDKKASPVSMTKLLSHGYMEDKKKSPNDDDTSSVTSEQTSTVETEEVEDLE